MGRVFLYMTMTLDGYLAGPHNELDWFKPGQDDEMNEDILRLLDDADSLMMGYPTAPGMMAYWKEAGENKANPKWMLDIARGLADKHVFVVSNKEEDPRMKDSELVVAKDDKGLVSAVKKLRDSRRGNICVLGGVRTGQDLSRLGLIDEYALMVHPVAIASGKPLFVSRVKLELVSCKSYKLGAIQVRYRPAKVD